MYNTETICLLLEIRDLVPRFGRPVPELNMISNLVIDTIYHGHNHRIKNFSSGSLLLNPTLLESYARAIQLIGRPLHDCFGFIDGPVRSVCRPDENQGRSLWT